MLLFTAANVQGANRYSVATGIWNATSTWSDVSGGASGFSVPVAGDVVYIEGGFVVTLNANASASTALNNGGATAVTLNIRHATGANMAFTISGDIAIAANGTFTTMNTSTTNRII